MRILIIGAGFGGLTVANSLTQKMMDNDNKKKNDGRSSSNDSSSNNNNGSSSVRIEYDLIDALQPPLDDCVFVGTIFVTAAKQVLKSLRLLRRGEVQKNCSKGEENDHNTNDNDYSRQELLDNLRQNISIKYKHVVQKIYQRSDSDNISVLWSKVIVNQQHERPNPTISNHNDNPCVIDMGPYDVVVLATGTRSQFPIDWSFLRNQYSINAYRRILAVGDLRSTRWWDFGLERIRQGANQALLDGLELGSVLREVARRQSMEENYDIVFAQLIPEKFLYLRTYRKFLWLGHCHSHELLLFLLAIFAIIQAIHIFRVVDE